MATVLMAMCKLWCSRYSVVDVTIASEDDDYFLRELEMKYPGVRSQQIGDILFPIS